MSLDETAKSDATHYAFKVSPVGAPSEIQLTDDAIAWQSGLRSLRIAYRDVREIRMLFRPVTLQNFRFVTEVKAKTGLKLTIASTSWRSMIEHERHDPHYNEFIAELHRRVAAAGGSPVYRAGSPAFLYWPGFVILTGLLTGTAILAVRAVQTGEWQGAAFIVLMLGFFLWQTIAFFRRNRPALYTPDKLPAQVMP